MLPKDVIGGIQSYDKDMRVQLANFSSEMSRYMREKEYCETLWEKIGWLERKAPVWVPFVPRSNLKEYERWDKDRVVFFNKLFARQQEIEEKLEFLKGSLERTRKEFCADPREFFALDQVVEAFNKFRRDFIGFNWYSVAPPGKLEDGYPDVKAIYDVALLEYDGGATKK